MSHALFHPIAGRADEIVDFIMQTEEVQAYPPIAYAVRLACEEVIVNIIHYAYPSGMDGYIGVNVSAKQESLQIEIYDGGIPFNPIDKPLPNVALEAEEREIGGLGIFLIRQMMDVTEYEYKEGENKLLLIKNITL